MKRILVMALALMLFAFPALGEGLDLSQMTLDELENLQQKVAQEINIRAGLSFDDSVIGSGYYTVGIDIKPGKYELICSMVDTGEYMTNGLVISETADTDAKELFRTVDVQVGQIIVINLEDGNMLVIARANYLIRPFDHTWAP